MLVLRRKQAETVVVDGRIQIKVLRISRNAISLGIDAPGDVTIWRGELEQEEELAGSTPALDAIAQLPLVQSA
jgi:carbon storage regulator